MHDALRASGQAVAHLFGSLIKNTGKHTTTSSTIIAHVTSLAARLYQISSTYFIMASVPLSFIMKILLMILIFL